MKQLITRVVDTITEAGISAGYFDGKESAAAFQNDLKFLLVNQKVAFNSPVFFNVGCAELEPENKGGNWHWNPETKEVEFGNTGYNNPQCTAASSTQCRIRCPRFLTSQDGGHALQVGIRYGHHFSVLRGSTEQLSAGGTASGPLSFMKGLTLSPAPSSGRQNPSCCQDGILDADHPDIEDFIAAKGKEELKAAALVREGYDGSGPDSEAYALLRISANNSVRVTDEFMEAAIAGRDWDLKARVDGSTTKTIKAADLLRQVATETHLSRSPGMQFDTTINSWHTAKASDASTRPTLAPSTCFSMTPRATLPASTWSSFLATMASSTPPALPRRFSACHRNGCPRRYGRLPHGEDHADLACRQLGLGYANLARFDGSGASL